MLEEASGYDIYLYYTNKKLNVCADTWKTEHLEVQTEVDGKTELFTTDSVDEYIEKLNSYLPEGMSFKVNKNKTYDIYMNNVNSDIHLVIQDGISEGNWSGNIYLTGKNTIESLRLIDFWCENKISIIGSENNELNLNWFDIDYLGGLIFNNCNINTYEYFSIRCVGGYQYENISIEGRVKMEMAPKTKIYIGIDENHLKELMGNAYNSEYAKVEDGRVTSYRSPEKVILKSYEDIKLLEQSAEKIKGGERITFRFDENVEKFEELYINEKLLKKDKDYTIKSGSTIVELSEEYTKTLKKGNYQIVAMFTKAKGVANFEVSEESKEEETNKEKTKTKKKLDNTPKTGTESYYTSYYAVLGTIFTIILGATLKIKK